MCELFAMSSRYPAVVSLSMEEFAKHGGKTAHHRDGWGIAYSQGTDAHVIREATAAATSPLMRCIENNSLASTCVLSHIRKATVGEIALHNTQPFQREMAGQIHFFAHNGHVPAIFDQALHTFTPVGQTDSEHGFCVLLEAIAQERGRSKALPSLEIRFQIIKELAAKMREMGPANFLYFDGEALFVHSDRRKQCDGSISPPGLHWLKRRCPPPEASGLTIEHSSEEEQQVILVASVPLTAEAWTPMARGQLVAMAGGQILLSD